MSTAITTPFNPSRLAQRLQASVGEGKYKLWFHAARYQWRDGGLDIAVPNRFTADWIEHHYHNHILSAAESELGAGVAIRVHIDPATASPAKPKPPHRAADAPARPAPLAPASLARPAAAPAAPRPEQLRYDLADFVVGPSNELAYTAACRILEPGDARFGMLFVHGGCGLGKTHLLQGLCRRYAAQHPDRTVVYTTAEQFTNDYIHAVRNNRINDFRKKLRHVDLLAVDDVHFLSNKLSTQQEFLHTFDAIDLSGARLVLASDAHPKLIKQFSDALVSRFMSGMVVQVHAPDNDTRTRIIHAMAQRRGLKLLDGVVDSLASQTAASVRELEGMLTKLQALASLTRPASEQDKPIGHALVHQLLGHADAASDAKPVRLDAIMHTVCDHLRVERSAVLGASRHRLVVLARSVIIYLARQMTTMSYPELARALSKPNHSTIVTAAQRIEQQIQQRQPLPPVPSLHGATMDQLVEQLRRRVGQPPAQLTR